MKTSISHRNRSAILSTAIALLSLTAALTGQAAPASISQTPDTTRIEDAPLMSDSLPCVRDSLQAPSEQELAAQLTQVNAPLTGKWLYDEPSVDAKGTGFVSKLGKPIAKSKLKKGLKKAYNKLKLKKRWTSLTLTAGGKWTLRLVGQNVSGDYTFDAQSGRLEFRWHGVPIVAHARRDGKDLHLLFDADKLLNMMRLLGKLKKSDTLKSLTKLSNNYRDVMVGFKLKPAH